MITILPTPAPEPDPEETPEEAEPTPAAAEAGKRPPRLRREHPDREAQGFVYHLLLRATGMQMALEDIRSAAAERGYSDRLLRSAAQKIGVEKIRGNGGTVAWKLILDPADAAPVPPKVVGQVQPATMPTLADVQRTFDAVFREYAGRKIPGVNLATINLNVELRDTIAKDLRARLGRLGIELPEFTADGDRPLASAAAAILNGNRPIANLDSFPMTLPRAVDTRVHAVRAAETSLAAAERAYREAKRQLDRERAGAAT